MMEREHNDYVWSEKDLNTLLASSDNFDGRKDYVVQEERCC